MYLTQICFLLMLAACVVQAAPESTTRQAISEDALDMALKDKRYLMRQMKCALGEGPCDPVGRRLKSLAPLVLMGSCPQCSPSETRQIQKVLAHIQKNYPREWGKILQHYSG